jgi:hypothetical protein
MKNFIGGLIVSLAILFCVVIWIPHIVGDSNERLNDLTGYWELADKGSSIIMKSDNIDKYVAAIERLKLNEGYSGIILHNFSNNMSNNYDAIKSLQTRLHQIKSLDVQSMAYQVAMQQLTSQEWGQAEKLTEQFDYKYSNTVKPWTLGYLSVLPFIGFALVAFVGIAIITF